jgi:hypothetical protein
LVSICDPGCAMPGVKLRSLGNAVLCSCRF